MPRYTLQSSQFGLVDGAYQTTSPFGFVAPPRRPESAEARKGQLFVLTEACEGQSNGNEACRLVATTLNKSFYANSSNSITTALRVALVDANRVLYQHNFKVPPPRRAQVGVTCAVVRDADLFVAQVAPAQAYVLRSDQIRAFPEPLHWRTAHTSATPFLHITPLGHSLFVEPELHRCLIGSGDGLLLCHSNLAPLLQRGDLVALLATGNAEQITDALLAVSTDHALATTHALAVTLAPAAAAARSPAPATAPKRPLKPARSPRTPPPHQRSVAAPDPDVPTLPAPAPEVPALDLGEELPQRNARTPQALPLPSLLLGEGEVSGKRLHGDPIDLSDPYLRDTPATPYQPRRVRRPLSDMGMGERLVYPFHLLGDEIEDRVMRPMRRRSKPASNAPRRRDLPTRPVRAEQTYAPRPILSTVMGILVIGTIVTLLFLYGSSVARQEASESTAGYLAVAEARMQQVQQATTLQEARENLADAQQALDVLRTNPMITDTNAAFWLRYQSLREDTEAAEASILKQTYLDQIEVVATHPTPGRAFTRLVVPPATSSLTDSSSLAAVQYIYALDGNRETAQMYRIPRSGGTPDVMLTPGQIVQNTEMGPPQAIAWRLDNVVAIDQGVNGFGYFFASGGVWNHIRLGASEVWTPDRAPDLETYEGNLYVWGAEPNEILKYNSGRYGDFPDLWLATDGRGGRDIGTAVDMVIDGVISLLQPDGRILIFSQGQFTRELAPPVVEPPVSLVTRFYTVGSFDTGSYFILDTLHERVIQIDKLSGEVLQQIHVRPDSPFQLNQLLDLAVVEEGGKLMLYLINGDQVLRSTLPPVPRPFTPEAAVAPSG